MSFENHLINKENLQECWFFLDEVHKIVIKVQPISVGFEPRRNASRAIALNKEIKVAKWGTSNKYILECLKKICDQIPDAEEIVMLQNVPKSLLRRRPC